VQQRIRSVVILSVPSEAAPSVWCVGARAESLWKSSAPVAAANSVPFMGNIKFVALASRTPKKKERKKQKNKKKTHV